VIAGDGDGEDDIRRRAEAVNDRASRELVLMPGLLEDPREAYAASDVVLGMGGSALRGLAFAKPLIVVGTDGYSQLFTPETSGEYLVQGFWGHGDGGPGTAELTKTLRSLVDDPALCADLGAFGRRFVCTRFALADMSARLESVLQAATTSSVPPDQRRTDAASALARLSAVRLQGWVRRRGSRLRDA
jgi:glycosyltransferase involved in cell wall biosynthesis